MENDKSYRVVIALDELRPYEKILEEKYPLVHAASHAGICDFIDEALFFYQARHLHFNHCYGSYIDATIDKIDYRLSLLAQDMNLKEFSPMTGTELYSREFFDFLMEIFNIVSNALNDVVAKERLYIAADGAKYFGNTAVIITLRHLTNDQTSDEMLKSL